ncbi:50S ribosomal protein L5 [Candidatus Omnitrophota bacterium]
MPTLSEKYRTEIIAELTKKFQYKNKLQVPRLEKIVVNMGVGEGSQDIKILEQAMKELATITGQKPIICKARKAISNFKIRAGQPIGCKVTLRKAVMYEFLSRLINVALPRIRDFTGVSGNAFDQAGNYSLGLKDQTIFPEIEYDKVQRVQGMDVCIVTTARSKEEAKELLRLFGMPFKR